VHIDHSGSGALSGCVGILPAVAAHEIPKTGEVVVMLGRRRSGAWAVFFGVFTIAAAVRGVTTDNGTELALAVVVFGLPFILFGYWAVRRRPALVIGPDAVTEGRSGRREPAPRAELQATLTRHRSGWEDREWPGRSSKEGGSNGKC
jgi:hypothetical protein